LCGTYYGNNTDGTACVWDTMQHANFPFVIFGIFNESTLLTEDVVYYSMVHINKIGGELIFGCYSNQEDFSVQIIFVSPSVWTWIPYTRNNTLFMTGMNDSTLRLLIHDSSGSYHGYKIQYSR
jgi:hypothetical protein